MAQTDRNGTQTDPPAPPLDIQEVYGEIVEARDAALAAQLAAEAAAEAAIGGGIVRGTPVTTNGAAAYDFDIPDGVQWFNLLLSEVSTVSASSTSLIARAIVGGTPVTSGYRSVWWTRSTESYVATYLGLADIVGSGLETKIRGLATFINYTGNEWACISNFTGGVTGIAFQGQNLTGTIALLGELDAIRIAALSGASIFNGGTITPFWRA